MYRPTIILKVKEDKEIKSKNKVIKKINLIFSDMPIDIIINIIKNIY